MRRDGLVGETEETVEKRGCPCNCPDELTHLHKQIDLLADFLLANYQDEFWKVPEGESATEMAVRLLTKPQDEPKESDTETCPACDMNGNCKGRHQKEDEPCHQESETGEGLIGVATRNIAFDEWVREKDVKKVPTPFLKSLEK